jgi:hypothetical protein
MNYKITYNTKESFDLAFIKVCELLRKKNNNKANKNEINKLNEMISSDFNIKRLSKLYWDLIK